jgi:hypothetical protein
VQVVQLEPTADTVIPSHGMQSIGAIAACETHPGLPADCVGCPTQERMGPHE